MKLRSDPINTFIYEAFKQQFHTTLMKSKAEQYKNCAEFLKGSDFRKAKNLFLGPEKQFQWYVLFQMAKFRQ